MPDNTASRRIRLTPTPRYEDDRIRVRVDPGTTTERYREASRSIAHYRAIEVENRTEGWIALLVGFPERADCEGCRVAPGGTGSVTFMYAFERDALHGPSVYTDAGGATEGRALVFLNVEAETAPPGHHGPRGALAQLDPECAEYQFVFDVRYCDGPGYVPAGRLRQADTKPARWRSLHWLKRIVGTVARAVRGAWRAGNIGPRR